MIRIIFSNRFIKCYKKIDPEARIQIDKTIKILANNPKHPSLRLKRIQGTKGIWEISVTMSIRITLTITDGSILLRNVGTHEQVLRPPY